METVAIVAEPYREYVPVNIAKKLEEDRLIQWFEPLEAYRLNEADFVTWGHVHAVESQLDLKFRGKLLEGFNPVWSPREDRRGARFELVRALTDGERDPLVGDLYEIEFEDGLRDVAWPEEIFENGE